MGFRWKGNQVTWENTYANTASIQTGRKAKGDPESRGTVSGWASRELGDVDIFPYVLEKCVNVAVLL